MANRFTFPRETALDANGNPLAGAKLYFYESGTTNPADTFADEALTIANTNPVVANSAGRFGDIFLQAVDYKVILKDAADVTIWTADPVAGTIDATGDKFTPSQQNPADMTVLIGPGTIWDIVAKTRLVLAAQTTSLIVAPVGNPRNDIVYIDRVTGIVGVAAGTEAASPSDPTIPDGKLPVARVRLATTTIEITSDLIDDIRELESLGDFGPQDIQGRTFTAFDDTGAANAYVITPAPAISAYAKYQSWVVDIANANTGASTMNISGLGARNIFDFRTGAALTGQEMRAGLHTFVDDGTQLMLMNPAKDLARFFAFDDATDVPFSSNVPTGTVFSSAQNILIPPKGLLRFNFHGRIFNASTAVLPFYIGLRINGVDYWPEADLVGVINYAQLSTIAAGDYREYRGAIDQPAGWHSPEYILDIEGRGIATGLQSIQPVIAVLSGATVHTLQGVTAASRMKLAVEDYS